MCILIVICWLYYEVRVFKIIIIISFLLYCVANSINTYEKFESYFIIIQEFY
jgi:hypothetical protein